MVYIGSTPAFGFGVPTPKLHLIYYLLSFIFYLLFIFFASHVFVLRSKDLHKK